MFLHDSEGDPFGAPFGPSWVTLGTLWAPWGLSWVTLGALWAPLCVLLGDFGAALGFLGTPLGQSWVGSLGAKS